MSQERVSGFAEKGADLIAVKFHSERTSGEVAEKNFWGSSGNFRGSPGTFQKLGGA